MAEKLLTVAEVAARLNCHPHTVRRWIWSKRLKAVKVGDLVRIPENEVDQFIQPPKDEATSEVRGARALLAVMDRLKKTVDARDVERMEALMREAEQPADWKNPLA